MKVQLDGLNNVNSYVKLQKKDFEDKLLDWKNKSIDKLIDRVAENNNRLSVVNAIICCDDFNVVFFLELS
jgi:hypothetical protein